MAGLLAANLVCGRERTPDAQSTEVVRAIDADAAIVISQVYGGGGNTSAVYQNDFVELFNRSTMAVPLAGRSIQYTSPTGTGNFSQQPITALTGTLQPARRCSPSPRR